MRVWVGKEGNHCFFVKLFFLAPRVLVIIRRLVAASSMGLSPPAGSLSAALIA